MSSSISEALQSELLNYPRDDSDGWLVTALLVDGRVFSNVRISESFSVSSRDIPPFPISDLVAVLPESATEVPNAAPTELFSTIPISPWEETVALISPDGTKRATIFGAGEIAMGAPTRGTLRLNGAVVADGCSSSMVWSRDSRRLAVPQWTALKKQRLLIVDATAAITHLASDQEFRVLQLERFEEDIVYGIDSPIYMPRHVVLAVQPYAPM